MRPVEFRNLLREGKAADLGIHPETGLRHRLFYAAARRACYVALQAGDRLIVDVWTVKRHARKAWEVSAEAQFEARRLACPEEDGPWEPWVRPPVVTVGIPRTVVRVAGFCITPEGRSSVISLGSWPLAAITGDVSLLGYDLEFLAEVRRRASAKGFPPDRIEAIGVHLGRDGGRPRVWPPEDASQSRLARFRA